MNEVENQEPLEGEFVRSKAWHAYQLKMAGLKLPEIAERLNYSSPGAVGKAIKDQLIAEARDIEPETKDTLLELEIDRLDYVQSRIWMQVEAGDLKAVETFLKIVQVRAKLRGLDVVDAAAGQHTVLVISGNEKDYIDKLKELAGE